MSIFTGRRVFSAALLLVMKAGSSVVRLMPCSALTVRLVDVSEGRRGAAGRRPSRGRQWTSLQVDRRRLDIFYSQQIVPTWPPVSFRCSAKSAEA